MRQLRLTSLNPALFSFVNPSPSGREQVNAESRRLATLSGQWLGQIRQSVGKHRHGCCIFLQLS